MINKDKSSDNNSQKRMYTILLKFIREGNIGWLVFSPMLVSFGFLIGAAFVADELFHGEVPEIYTSIGMMCFLLIFSLSGLAQVYRREAPGLLGRPYKGSMPVLSGITIVLICWAVVGYIIYSFFSNR